MQFLSSERGEQDRQGLGAGLLQGSLDDQAAQGVVFRVAGQRGQHHTGRDLGLARAGACRARAAGIQPCQDLDQSGDRFLLPGAAEVERDRVGHLVDAAIGMLIPVAEHRGQCVDTLRVSGP